MTARITSGQVKQLVRFCEDGVDTLSLTKDGAQRVIAQGDVLQARLKQVILELAAKYFIPLKDEDVPAKYQPILAKYRAEARRQGIPDSTPLCYLVVSGFTLKHHAPKAGPCHENFQYLQSWNFPDEPTQECVVFWIPRLVPESTGKDVDEQRHHLAKFCERLALPAHHCTSFGDVALIAGLILAHHKATGEKVPLDGLWARTNTCSADGHRLLLGWLSDALLCVRWYWDGARAVIGVFALGVEALGS